MWLFQYSETLRVSDIKQSKILVESIILDEKISVESQWSNKLNGGLMKKFYHYLNGWLHFCLHTRSRRRLFASNFCLSEYPETFPTEFPAVTESKSVGLSPTIHSMVRTLFRVKCGNTFGTFIKVKEEWTSCI